MRDKTRITRLVFEFPDNTKALEWFDTVVEFGLLPDGVDAFHADGLDLSGHVPPNTYIVRKINERPSDAALRHRTGKG